MTIAAVLGIRALVLFLGFAGTIHGAAIQRRASSGCSKPHNFVGQTREFSFESSGGTRTYRIHLPSSYKVGSPMPLLIAYHGSGNNPTAFERETRFSDEIINPNMITVYPAGVNKNWQGPTYATPGVSDKVFTTDLVNRIKNNYCVDEARVYGTGHSNGAGFLGTLACSPEHGGQFAAFAPISGAFYTDVSGDENCHPSRSPIPMFEVHGTADPTISYDGGQGRGGPLPSIPDWLSRWARRNRCSTSNTEDIANGAHDTKWTCANIPGLLEHIKIDGHDHSWPGPNNSPVDVSPLVIKFLSNNYKP
ncbi:carbohydrate esterase family 1 [Purpureocillium lilacinum]|uniref:feruloyl esterase n=1 Tax=Purpureocillium lilacinum TaxID=33203 RepID=A0A179HMF0_PURLI|nr:carbohydrate esterase family 1 [Purpureocillium lilacinum]OAQ90639.1 carbohydrate esterase family 1 [Purpureocillium lilacinum]